MIRTALIVFTALTAFAGVASAEVSPLPTTQRAEVRLSDIDLSTASGARVALVRIEQAAITVCGGQPDDRYSDNQKLEFSTCYAKAVRSAANDSHAPVLTAMIRDQVPVLMASN